tara:strand:- start:582 stop:1202 length:621 start_codon:yes stop_codon:yes gene_type:complete
MAIISSYPVITPQLPDKILGSNNVDSAGDPVLGNPTVQYTLTSIKELVDQNFVQQLSSSNVGNQSYPLSNNKIVFGVAESGVNVSIDAAGKVTFIKAGTYYVQQRYLYGVSSQATRYFTFRSVHTTATVSSQYGPTSVDITGSNMTNPERKPMYINYMIKVVANDTLEFESLLDANGYQTEASLYNSLLNQWGTVPSAQIIISKLI